MLKRVYKQSTLERYGAAGWLDYGNPNYSAIDRISAGNRLFADFYLGGINRVGAVDMARIRVDGRGNECQPVWCLHHRDSYEKAMRAVPHEFWPVVRRVCLEDEDIETCGSEKQVKKMLYAGRVDLCRGLDRLIEFYLRRRVEI